MKIDLRAEFKKIVGALLLEHPFYGILLSKIRVEEDSELFTTAATDGRKIVVNPVLLMNLQEQERIGIFIHELHHILEMHPKRRKELMRRFPIKPEIIYNIVEDAKVNQHIMNSFKLPPGTVTPDVIEARFGIKEPEKKSYEEIIAELYKKARKMPCGACRVISQEDRGEGDERGQCRGSGREGERKGEGRGSGGGSEGEEKRAGDVSTEPLQGKKVVNEGSKDLNEADDWKEFERRLKEAIIDAYQTAKTIGKLPAGLERYIRGLVKEKVDWRRILRQTLEFALGYEVFRTYTRPSKKSWFMDTEPELPSKRTFGVGRIVALIDTSGSISEQELRQFVSEVYAIFRESSSEIIVIPWDAEAYKPTRIRNVTDIKKIKLYGGGGTVIYDALAQAIRYKPELTIILSDFEIYDIDHPETQKLLYKLARKSRLVMITTSAQPPRIPGTIWRKIEF